MNAVALLERAVRAATIVAARHGLAVPEPVVLAHHSNAMIHLAPTPVVARVATVTAELRPGPDWLRREVEVAGYLAAMGAAVVPPSDELPPGPHGQDGLYLTFWRLTPAVGEIDAGAAGAALREIHDALAHYGGAVPALDPLGETDRLLARAELAPDDRGLLARAREEAAAVLSRLPPPRQALHGDGHLSNVILTSHGPLWCDLEDTCLGPVEWDLACLATAARLWRDTADERAALDAYGEHDAALVEALVPVRALFTTAWGLHALAQGARDSSRAARRLAWWRERYASRP
jgi:Phosphotransferase enzyme family